MKYLLSICCFFALTASSSSVQAQAIFAASETTRIQAGVGGILLNTDYSEQSNKGIAAWADYDFHRFLGIEAQANLGGLIAPGDIGENSYLVGPRVLYRRRRYTGYAKFLVGRGSITDQLHGGTSVFNMYAVGGGLEYKVSRRFNVRAIDFEMQKWPDFKPSSLSPTVITVGLSYVIR